MMETTKILEALDDLGFNKEIVTKRAWIGRNISNGSTVYHRNIYRGDFDVVLTGSRREGIGTTFDTDVDQMFVDNDFLCIEPTEAESCEDINSYRAVFLLDRNSTPAGYTFLRLLKKNTAELDIPKIKDALEWHKKSYILRNDKVWHEAVAPLLGNANQLKVMGWMKKTYKLSENRNGPSASYTMEIPYANSKIYFDDCLAYRCRVPSLIKLWSIRERKFDWPSTSLIATIGNMAGHVVPVGMKGHPDNIYQWRICFNEAEIALVESFNDTQIKVYAVLKNLIKPVFRPICDGITSYVMKNIVFWISEEVPISRFQTKDFADRLRRAFEFLENCIDGRHLPSYMIDSRNLLEGKVSDTEKGDLLQTIRDLLVKGPSVAESIPKVDKLIKIPEEDRKTKAKVREMSEQLLLAAFALPTKETADMLLKFQSAPTQQHVIDIFMKNVIPYVRSHNPQGFFTHLQVDDSQIYKFFRKHAKL